MSKEKEEAKSREPGVGSGAVDGLEIEKIEVEEKINELEILKQSYESKKQEYDKLYGQLLLLGAEFDNYRKRTEKEMRENFADGRREMVLKIFPVLDSIEKALSMMETGDNRNKAMLEGIRLIQKHFLDILEKEGVGRMEARGKQFDPACHHAVMAKETGQEEENTVLEELQPGYFYGDKVLRPAMVVVSRKPGKENGEEKNKKEE